MLPACPHCLVFEGLSKSADAFREGFWLPVRKGYTQGSGAVVQI